MSQGSAATDLRWGGRFNTIFLSSRSENTTPTLVQPLVSCGLDYYNSLLHCVSDSLIQKVQAVRYIRRRRRPHGSTWCHHSTPMLHQLNWLSVRRHVEDKVACLLHQSLSGWSRDVHARTHTTNDIISSLTVIDVDVYSDRPRASFRVHKTNGGATYTVPSQDANISSFNRNSGVLGQIICR